LKQALGYVFVHTDGGAEDSSADEGQAREIEQTLDRAVFAEGAMHHWENNVDALAAAAAVQFHEGGIRGVGGHHDPLAAFQDFRQHFLRAYADEPMAFFGDADGHWFIFVRVEAANHGCCRGERNLMLAGAAAEEDTNPKSFLVVRGHYSISFRWVVELIQVISYK
jgi:hypothetical protein